MRCATTRNGSRASSSTRPARGASERVVRQLNLVVATQPGTLVRREDGKVQPRRGQAAHRARKVEHDAALVERFRQACKSSE